MPLLFKRLQKSNKNSDMQIDSRSRLTTKFWAELTITHWNRSSHDNGQFLLWDARARSHGCCIHYFELNIVWINTATTIHVSNREMALYISKILTNSPIDSITISVYFSNRIYNKNLDRDWFSASLFVS